MDLVMLPSDILASTISMRLQQKHSITIQIKGDVLYVLLCIDGVIVDCCSPMNNDELVLHGTPLHLGLISTPVTLNLFGECKQMAINITHIPLGPTDITLFPGYSEPFIDFQKRTNCMVYVGGRAVNRLAY